MAAEAGVEEVRSLEVSGFWARCDVTIEENESNLVLTVMHKLTSANTTVYMQHFPAKKSIYHPFHRRILYIRSRPCRL